MRVTCDDSVFHLVGWIFKSSPFKLRNPCAVDLEAGSSWAGTIFSNPAGRTSRSQYETPRRSKGKRLAFWTPGARQYTGYRQQDVAANKPNDGPSRLTGNECGLCMPRGRHDEKLTVGNRGTSPTSLPYLTGPQGASARNDVGRRGPYFAGEECPIFVPPRPGRAVLLVLVLLLLLLLLYRASMRRNRSEAARCGGPPYGKRDHWIYFKRLSLTRTLH
jgi:hypothetical protein